MPDITDLIGEGRFFIIAGVLAILFGLYCIIENIYNFWGCKIADGIIASQIPKPRKITTDYESSTENYWVFKITVNGKNYTTKNEMARKRQVGQKVKVFYNETSHKVELINFWFLLSNGFILVLGIMALKHGLSL